jgi:lipopolysaccharide/colanic/teichoic acid biosynthesis glycosyltransferase
MSALRVEASQLHRFPRFLVAKRLFDIVISAVGLFFLSPIFLGIAVGLVITMGRPVFFVQPRPGLHGRPFKLVKFRTMTGEFGADGEVLPDSARLTRFGRFLRTLSLDELPELWNVLRGELSLVGPRPLLMEYLPLYSPEQARRHEVRPGITGWAQVQGRNALTWDEKFELDVWYVENRTFWFDLRILGLTVVKVLRREGISHANEATMPRFRGNGHERQG